MGRGGGTWAGNMPIDTHTPPPLQEWGERTHCACTYTPPSLFWPQGDGQQERGVWGVGRVGEVDRVGLAFQLADLAKAFSARPSPIPSHPPHLGVALVQADADHVALARGGPARKGLDNGGLHRERGMETRRAPEWSVGR